MNIGAWHERAQPSELGLLERRSPPTEPRVLLELLDRDASITEIAEPLVPRPVEIGRAGLALAVRGPVRRHHGGRLKETRLAITAAGLATMQALLTASSGRPRNVATLSREATDWTRGKACALIQVGERTEHRCRR